MKITDRRQKRFTKAETEKKFIAKYKKFDQLRKANDTKEIIELDKAEFRGFKRYFVMTERAEGSKYAADYKKLLQENNGIQYSNTKEFKTKKDKKKIEREMEISFSENELGKIPEKIRHLFIKKIFRQFGNLKVYKYYFTRLELFVVEVKKHYITHKLIPNSEIESELTKLQQELFTNRDNYAKLNHAQSHFTNYRSWHDEKDRYKLLDRAYISEVHKFILESNLEKK